MLPIFSRSRQNQWKLSYAKAFNPLLRASGGAWSEVEENDTILCKFFVHLWDGGMNELTHLVCNYLINRIILSKSFIIVYGTVEFHLLP